MRRKTRALPLKKKKTLSEELVSSKNTRYYASLRKIHDLLRGPMIKKRKYFRYTSIIFRRIRTRRENIRFAIYNIQKASHNAPMTCYKSLRMGQYVVEPNYSQHLRLNTKRN